MRARMCYELLPTILAIVICGAGNRIKADTCDPGIPALVIENPEPEASDLFGQAVAASGGYAIIGAGNDSPEGMPGVGSAYIIDSATGFVRATLRNPDPTQGDNFGYAVGLYGNSAVVGAPEDYPSGIRWAGTAYLYDASTGELQRVLKSPEPNIADQFGQSVAISRDNVVVGCPGRDSGASASAGSVYVFRTSTGLLGRTLTNPDPLNVFGFGTSIAISGKRIVVGAAASLGRVFVFNADTGEEQAVLNNPNPLGGDEFGVAVALAGNLAVVGARMLDVSGWEGAGAAYIYNATSGQLVATLNNPNPYTQQNFGWSVGISGIVVVVGEPRAIVGGVKDVGTAYQFNATTGELLSTVGNPDPAIEDYFGRWVAASGNRILVGAYGDESGGIKTAGRAFTFCIPSGLGRRTADFDESGCTDIEDFYFILDHWLQVSELGPPEIGIEDFLALIDFWHQPGSGCIE